jgi:Ni/Fe-hydrogenase subunit HybB-like protein
VATVLSIPSARPAGFWAFLRRELKPQGKWLTPFNVISLALMAATAVILVARFGWGLGAVTNLDQRFPWGIWIGFDVMAGVALAGGAYVVTFLVYILRMEKYHSIVRITVLNGFLAYVFYAGALLLDLGRPWNVVNPVIGNSFGLGSVLFLVAWHFLLYMMAQFVELSPAIAEWLGLHKVRRVLMGMTVAAVVFGITLSTLHQSALGALYLMAKPKIHPLWYSEFIPVLFFVSSIYAGLCMVIFEGGISHRVFHSRLSPSLIKSHDSIVLGLAKIAGAALFVNLFLEALKFLHGRLWLSFAGGWAAWYLVEIVGFGVVPMVLLLRGSLARQLPMVKVGAILGLVGVILNRLNLSVIAFKWYETAHYVPSWMEIVVTAGVISTEIWVFRWVVMRMPILADEHGHERARPASVQAVAKRLAS